MPGAAADGFAFTAPVAVGDEVSFYATIVATGRTSMTVVVEVWQRERHGAATSKAAVGSFILVAMGDDDRPRAIRDRPFHEGATLG